MADVESTSKSLTALGFSEYEARTYAGLVGSEPVTGYALSKRTGVPQPKVYETLSRLASHGAVIQIGNDPARWVALPPNQLLKRLEGDFHKRLAQAELHLSLTANASEADQVRPFWGSSNWNRIASRAEEFIDLARERVHVSGHSEQLLSLEDALLKADTRGVRVDILSFGVISLDLNHGTTVVHRSTEGMIYPHHQARHLALTVDRHAGLWALARSGDDWMGIWADNDDLLPALAKEYIRHDLYVQRIYTDFTDEMHKRYGPTLQGLTGRDSFPSNQAESDTRLA